MTELVYEAGAIDPIAAVDPDATFCPDCEKWIETALFVQHRELEHPPAVHGIAGAGAITSQETVGSPGGGR